MKYCNKCGAQLDENIKFCNKCGNKIKEQTKKITLDKNYEENNKQPYVKPADTADCTNVNLDNRNDRNYNNINSEQNERKTKPYKKFSETIAFKIVIASSVLCLILGGVFFNKIRGTYYMTKSSEAVIEAERIDYAVKAVKALENDESKEFLKNTLISISKNDLTLAEEKLNMIEDLLTQSDYQSISKEIKEKLINSLCASKNYDEAFAKLEELDKLGVDFKTNVNYDEIMFNIISKIAGGSVRDNKIDLMELEGIVYDNLDDDVYDEIIQIKNSYNRGGYSVKASLYKYKEGKYRQVDTVTLDDTYSGEIQGVFNYAEGKKGVYIYGNVDSSYLVSTSVYAVEDEKLYCKGIVKGKNDTRPEDINKDGIYEVRSSSESTVSSNNKEISKWYRINEDGSTPTEIKQDSDSSGSSSSETGTESSDYIFADSDSRYLNDEDLSCLSKEQLALARNEIFARHGYVFKEEPFKSYFSEKSWYVPNSYYDGNDNVLNQYEVANYQAIQVWENR